MSWINSSAGLNEECVIESLVIESLSYSVTGALNLETEIPMQGKIRKRFLLPLILLSVWFLSCSHIAERPREIADQTKQEERTVPDVCTSDSECPSGSSCWYQVPRGPVPGIKGSTEKPGRCYRNEAIRKSY
jgi:hypothetical protein